MSIMTSFVLFACIWAIVFYMVNPLWQTSQSEAEDVVPGTPASAPVEPMIRKKVIVTTVIATVLFAIAFCAIEFEWLTLEHLKLFTFPSER